MRARQTQNNLCGNVKISFEIIHNGRTYWAKYLCKISAENNNYKCQQKKLKLVK
jgi:hypothetical protein